MTSKVQFTQPRTAYDEEQAYQRHLAYLRTQSKNSQGFQDSLRNIQMGNMPTADAPQTADEILGDENEINRRVQSILGKLFTDSREQYNPLGVETRDEFDKRARPSTYLMNGLPNEMKVLLVTEAPSILAELKNKKLLTADTFLNYLDHYNEAFRESGGTSKYNTNNKLLGDITALINMLPQQDTIDGLTGLVARLGAQSIMSRMQNQDEMKRILKHISDKLSILKHGIPTTGDLQRVAQSVSQGTMDILQNQNNMRRGLTSQAYTYYNESKKNASLARDETAYADASRIRDMQQLDAQSMATQQVMDRLETLMQNIPTEEILNERMKELGVLLNALFIYSDQTSLKSDISQATVAIAQIKSTLLNLQDDLGAVTKIKMDAIENLLESIKEDTDFMAENTELATSKGYDARFKAQKRIETAKYKTELGLKSGSKLNAEQLREVDRRVRAIVNVAEATPVSMSGRAMAFAESLNPFESLKSDNNNNNTKDYDDESAPSGKDPFSSGKGFNRKNMNPRYARVMGKGIALESEPKKFYEFGKYMVSIPHLGNNILKVKYLLNGNDVPSFKASKISDDMADFIEDLIESGKMNERTLNKLDPVEKRLFGKLIKQSGLYEKYKIRALKNPDEKAEEDRFELVKGEFIAGNDNPAIVKELKHLIIKFMTEDRIPKREGHELLFQLSI